MCTATYRDRATAIGSLSELYCLIIHIVFLWSSVSGHELCWSLRYKLLGGGGGGGERKRGQFIIA